MKVRNILRFIGLTMAMVALGLAGGNSNASTYTWTNTTSGAFNDANNWDPTSGPPIAGDTANYDQGGTHLINFTADTAALAQINVTNGAGTYTFDVNDGTARTYDAGDPRFWAGTTIVTDAGTLITGGGNVNFGLQSAATALIVTNGATWRHTTDIYGYNGTIKATGTGSKIVVQSGVGIFLANGPQTVTVEDAGRIETPGPFTLGGGLLTVGGGSGISTMRVASAQFQTYNYAAADAVIKANGIVELTTGGLEIRDGYVGGGGGVSEFNMEGGKVTISPNQVIGLRNLDPFSIVEPLQRGTLRGTGIFERSSAGTNFRVENEGYIIPGDTMATPNLIGTLTFDGGSLFQTNTTQQSAGLRLDFNASTAGSADLLDFTGGTINITAGTNLFNNVGGSTLAYGTWNFLLADDITYSPSFDNMSAILAGLSLQKPDDLVTFGVVAYEGGEALQLSVVAVPEPSAMLLLLTGAAVMWRARRRSGRRSYSLFDGPS